MEIRITNLEKMPKLDLNLNLIKVKKLFKQFPDVQIEIVELKQAGVISSVCNHQDGYLIGTDGTFCRDCGYKAE